MPNDVSTVYDFAQELLALVADALASTDAGAPSIQYVAPELPSIDCCPAIIVAASSLAFENTVPITPGPVVGHRIQFHTLNLLTLSAWTVRCSSQIEAGQFPNPTEMNAVSLMVHQDLWAVWNFVREAVRTGAIWEGRCMAVYMDPPVPLADSGGCAGWNFTFRTAIQGYEVTLT